MLNKIDYSLYLVTDTELFPRENLLSTVEKAILGGVTVVQLREKNISSRLFYEEACALLKITKKYGVPLIINDRVDIMLASGADGIHAGQSDLPASVIRKIIGKDKILGFSAGTACEAKKAEADGADYIGVGAVFPTATKTDAVNTGIDTLTESVKNVKIPTIAIGGINEQSLEKLYGCGADGVAVVSAIMGSDDPKAASERLLKMVRNL